MPLASVRETRSIAAVKPVLGLLTRRAAYADDCLGLLLSSALLQKYTHVANVCAAKGFVLQRNIIKRYPIIVLYHVKFFLQTIYDNQIYIIAVTTIAIANHYNLNK